MEGKPDEPPSKPNMRFILTIAIEQVDKSRPKAKAVGTRNDVTKAVTAAPRRGRSAGQHPHDANKDGAEKPSSEAEQSKKDTCKKRHRTHYTFSVNF
jgi:hypothetical protein